MTTDSEGREGGLIRAYDFVLPSYGWAAQRLDAVTARTHALLTYAATLTFGAPIAIKAIDTNADLSAWWFYSAVMLFGVIGAVGVASELLSLLPGLGLILINPSALTEDDWLLLPDETFKLEVVTYAGEHMKHNLRLVGAKQVILHTLSGLFIVEVIFLGWGLTRVL